MAPMHTKAMSCNISKCRLLCVVAFALFVTSCVGRGSSSADSSLEMLQSIDLADTERVDTIDFGKVRTGEVLERRLALKNGSENPILLVKTDTSCGCLEMEYPKEPIKADGVMGVTLRFFSSGYNYFTPRSFFLVTSASQSPKRLVVTATIE